MMITCNDDNTDFKEYSKVMLIVTDQEVHARAKHPYNEHDRQHLDDTNVIVLPNDVQQLQQLRCVEQADETQELQTFTKNTQQPSITNYGHKETVSVETSETTLTRSTKR